MYFSQEGIFLLLLEINIAKGDLATVHTFFSDLILTVLTIDNQQDQLYEGKKGVFWDFEKFLKSTAQLLTGNYQFVVNPGFITDAIPSCSLRGYDSASFQSPNKLS